MVRITTLITLWWMISATSLFSQSCPNPYPTPQISDLSLCVFEGSTNGIDVGDSVTSQNDAYEFFKLTSSLPSGVSFDETTGQFSYDPPSGSGLFQSFTLQACQIIDPSCLVYTDTCSGQTSGISFIYVGEDGNDVYIFEVGECAASATPLACGENLQYGDLLIWPEGPSVSNIEIYIGDNPGGCSSFSCSNPDIVQHVSCATLIEEVMGQVIGGSLLAYEAVGNNNGGNKRKEVNNSAGYDYEYCSAEVTVSINIKGTAIIGDQLYLDLDGSKTYNSSDLPLANVEVTLTDVNGNTRTTTTDNSGHYQFDQLPAGDYTITVNTSTLPSGTSNTVDPDGGNNNQASVMLSAGEQENSIDFGYQGSSSVGDQLFIDVDGNGLYSTISDFPIAGVEVTLIDNVGNSVTVSTGTDGSYLFDNLPAGSYQILVNAADLPSGVSNTADPDNDGNNNEANFNLQNNQDLRTIDFGYQGNASVGDVVYLDLNNNQTYDPGIDQPFDGVTMSLSDGEGNIITTQTDQNGNYLFDNLPAGTYTVMVGTQDLPAGVTNTADPDGNTAHESVVNLSSNENDLAQDFGYRGNVTIGDQVFLDANANGVNDNESGVAGVTVTLYDGDGNQVGEPTLTDNQGLYSFSGLIAGSYYVVVSDLPGSYQFTEQNTGTDDTKDSDVNTTTGQSQTVTLNTGESDLTLDAGIYALGSVTNYVWHDFNANGIQDPGEPDIAGATVKISGGGTIISRTTDANGEYTFSDLKPGDYTVEFILPSGYDASSPQDAGSDDNNDSDADPSSGLTSSFSLSSGQHISNIDAGFYQTASLGDLIWEDKNANGIQDNGELGIPGIEVRLLDGNGTYTGVSVFTDLDGMYSFDNLEPGAYMVEIVYPAGLSISPLNQGSDDSVDSDFNPTTDRSGIYTLGSGETDLTADAGLYREASLGNYVWIDSNGNGIQDSGEMPIQGVIVTLYDGNGSQVGSSMTTDNNGAYSFTGLTPGDYYVVFSGIPSGAEFTQQNTGFDDTVDSDVDPSTGRTATTTLLSGENDTGWDAGIYTPATIGNFVWIDVNGDGIKDATEVGKEGVLVLLKDEAGNEIGSMYTDADGYYQFTGLVPDTYTIELAHQTLK
ncbi:MAG: carboxypeptidase regulatory-like domain-containing protein [Saprospiraceae bacterium]|nr:carboxypeptidase regulatory-like domain-containing protein [Saprospiraceae bacterium]